ncbi:MAG: flagellar M-ring protein FliF, partial [Rhodospirillaceae bacterium TMED167]
SIEAVKSARVHLVMSKRQLFSRDKQRATASVILKLKGASSLSNGQIAAIQYLVAAAVPALDPTKVSIVDSRGKLLAKGTKVDSAAARSNTLVERKAKFENRMAEQLTDLLERSVGIGNAKVTVQADLDFDRISTTEETFDPDGQVARSTKSIEESSNAEEAEGSEPVTVQTNIPDGLDDGDATGNTSRNVESRAEEVTNFEISKKIINHVREIGLVRRLSVAVLIDGELVENESGDVVYRERSQKEMEELGRLVFSAAGIVENRGDRLEIINMRFVEDEVEEDEPLSLLFGLDNNEIIRIAEVIVLLILAVLVILLVIRPLVTRAFEALPAAAAAAEQKLLEEAAAMSPALTGPETTPETDTEYEELIDIDRVEGRVKASSVKKVGEIVEKHPEEALSIVRNWMYQEA